MKRLVVALVCLVVSTACQGVSSESIERWKGTQKGPGKLQEAVKGAAVPPQLRAAAAAALTEIGMADEAEQALAVVPLAERQPIVEAFIPLEAARLNDPSLPRARAARDALFGVRAHATPAQQRQIDTVLIPSLERDLREGRGAGGRHSVEAMVAAIGPAAAPMLVSLLEDPRVPFQGVVDALERVADPAARDRGGLALVKRAIATREISPALWRAIGIIGGPGATNFLLQKTTTGAEKEAVAAAQALQQRRDPALLPVALRLAGDGKANKAVREEMFGLVEKIKGPEAQRGLVRIIAADPAELVRYRAFEAALAVGQGEAITPALEAFPATASYKREDVVDYLVKDVTKVGLAAKPVLAKLLSSPSALARMVALLSYEAPLPADTRKSLGGAADVAAVLKLSGDKGTVRGFPSGDTVGKEAARVAAILQKRVGS